MNSGASRFSGLVAALVGRIIALRKRMAAAALPVLALVGDVLHAHMRILTGAIVVQARRQMLKTPIVGHACFDC